MPRIMRYVLLTTLLLAPGIAAADAVRLEVTLTPSSPDLGDLDHTCVYFWGFDAPVSQRSDLAAATLTFHNIRDWTSESNVLYTHLLDYAALGVKSVSDNQAGNDYFVTRYTGVNRQLVTYRNLSTTPQDLVYVFSADDVATLRSYLADGRAGLGFDPDCHFYNDGVQLSLVYAPEPASIGLLGLGGLGWLLRRR